jgi:hypothetical protein
VPISRLPFSRLVVLVGSACATITTALNDLAWIVRGCAALAMLLVLSQAACAQQVYVEDFLNSTFTPETAWQPALTAGFSNWVSQPPGFGSGWSGYGYHYGVAVADNINGKFMRKFAFAAISRHEDGFIPIQTGTKWKRIGLALEHSLFVSAGASPRSFNWSGLPASLASAALSNAYQPAEQRSVSATFIRFGTNCGGYAAGDVWYQFLQIVTKHRVVYRVLTNR